MYIYFSAFKWLWSWSDLMYSSYGENSDSPVKRFCLIGGSSLEIVLYLDLISIWSWPDLDLISTWSWSDLNPFTPVVAIRQRKSHFFKRNIKPKPSIICIQTFFEHVLYIMGSNSDKKVLKRLVWVECSQSHAIFRRWGNGHWQKICW